MRPLAKRVYRWLNRLLAHVGLRLERTVRHDHPSPEAGPAPGPPAPAPEPAPATELELRGVKLDLTGAWLTPTIRAAVCGGYYEAKEAEILQATLAADDRVLEIGSGIGFLAVLASRAVDSAVRGYEADPALVDVARATIRANDAGATVDNAVVIASPTSDTTTFYVRDDFWVSSLDPDPAAQAITVPVLDLAHEITKHAASYLVVDIEGAETELFAASLPKCVRKLNLECHPAVTSDAARSQMLTALLAQGFSLNLVHSDVPVLFFER